MLGPKESPVTSSRPLDPRRRTLDQTCCNGVVARPADDGWLTAGGDGWKSQMCTCSSPPGTGDPSSVGTDGRAYTGHVEECPANVAWNWNEADETSHGQTSMFLQ